MMLKGVMSLMYGLFLVLIKDQDMKKNHSVTYYFFVQAMRVADCGVLTRISLPVAITVDSRKHGKNDAMIRSSAIHSDLPPEWTIRTVVITHEHYCYLREKYIDDCDLFHAPVVGL
jgi:hypothetical protein